jgi:hypothetical protein
MRRERCVAGNSIDLGTGWCKLNAMIRIAITAAAFEATVATLPLGSVGFDRELKRDRVSSPPSLRAGDPAGFDRYTADATLIQRRPD